MGMHTRDGHDLANQTIYENSWQIIVPIERDFTKAIQHFYCVCGHSSEHLISSEEDVSSSRSCPRCHNRDYFDANHWKRVISKQVLKHLNWDYRYSTEHGNWKVKSFFRMPYLQNRSFSVEATEISLCSLSLDGSGQIKYVEHDKEMSKLKLHSYDNNELGMVLQEEMISHLYQVVKEHIDISLEWIDFQKLENLLRGSDRLASLAFFIKHPHIRDIRLFRWNFEGCVFLRSQVKDVESGWALVLGKIAKKSVQRALYQHYRSLQRDNYYVLFDYVCCRVFRDENYLKELIAFSGVEKQRVFHGYTSDQLLAVFDFLLRDFSERELYRLLLSVRHDTRPLSQLRDIFKMVGSQETMFIYLEYFQRVRANINTIHDQLSKINRRYVKGYLQNKWHDLLKQPFRYDQSVKACFTGVSEHLRFQLPKSAEELYLWADELQNCMASYLSSVLHQRCVIIGVYEKETLKYGVEWRDGRIQQMAGKYNQSVPHDVATMIRQWISCTMESKV